MAVKVCCLCNKVEHNGMWRYSSCLVENAGVSHGYCPQCFRETMAEIEKLCAVDFDGSNVSIDQRSCSECV